EHLLKEIQRRCLHIVRAAFDRDLAVSGRRHQRWKDSLEDERGAASGPDREVITSRPDRSRNERERLRAQSCAFDLSTADLARSKNCSEMLAKKPRFFPLSPDIFHPECFSSREGKAKGGPQHLSAAFAR